MARVLITGGAGFIGSHIARFCAEAGAVVTVLDNLRTGRADNLAGVRARLVEGSVTDAALVTRLCQDVDYVFHMAAMVSVRESFEKPRECREVNVQGTLNVLEAARRQGVGKVVLSSSAAVYGDHPAVPVRESAPTAPISPYGDSKLEAERLAEQYTRQHGVPTASLRYFNVFGPRQDAGSSYAAAVPAFIESALAGRDLIIYGDGRQTRDFIHVRDVVAANVLAATSAMTGACNVASGTGTTIRDLATQVLELAGASSNIRYVEGRPGDIHYSVADIRKLRRAGFTPGLTVRCGLRSTIEEVRRTLPTPVVESCFVCAGFQPLYKSRTPAAFLASGQSYPACG